MDINNVMGRIFASETKAEKDVDGFWKIVTYMLEKISFDGKEYETRKVEAMGISKDFQEAFDTAMSSVLNQYTQITGGSGTLFTDSLHDVNDNSKVNEASKA